MKRIRNRLNGIKGLGTNEPVYGSSNQEWRSRCGKADLLISQLVAPQHHPAYAPMPL
jgi:hypothetical protein